MDLALQIRTRLAEGHSPDFIVAELVERGMSEASARRLVNRALTASKPRNEGTDAADPTGRVALIRGAFFLSAGVTITAVTYAVAKPGETYVITYGLAIAGVIAFARGSRKWARTRQPFPAAWVLAALVLPGAIGGGGYWMLREPTPEEARARAAKAEARAAEQTRQREEAERPARLAAAMGARREIADAVLKLSRLSLPSAERCEAARYFERRRIRDAEDELVRVLDYDPDMDVRRCAIDALAASGSTRALMTTLDRLAKYEGFRKITVYGYEKVLEVTSGSDRDRALLALDRLRQ